MEGVSPSSSETVAEHERIEFVYTGFEDKDALVIEGDLLATDTETSALSISPEESSAMAVHVMVSLGMEFVVAKSSEEPI